MPPKNLPMEHECQVMNPVLITLYEGNYSSGVASMINSAIASGFRGHVLIFHREKNLPHWTTRLSPTGQNSFEVAGCQIDFHRSNPPRHFGYHKPFAALEALKTFPDCDAVIYADPDIAFLAPWVFFTNWFSQGVAYCLDSNFPYLPADHPWRAAWRRLFTAATGKDTHSCPTYPNSGFFAVRRSDSAFLEDWAKLTSTFETQNGNTKSFSMSQRHLPVTGDQDLMAATLMGWNGPLSSLGPEGMGFTGHHFLLSHDIAPVKAWNCNFIIDALRGFPPSKSSSFFFQFCNSPIAIYTPNELLRKKVALQIAKAIGRIWKR